MIYINNNSTNPAYNLALEEYAFRNLVNEDEIFLLWINEPTIVVGKHQNTIEEINASYVRDNNIHVVRRISGGGAVYHDLGNLNYTIISKQDSRKAFDFKTFSKPVIETLAELGVKADFTGRNDLEIDGKKICGNAQAMSNNRLMHHGCLLFDVDLSVLASALNVSKDKIESKGIKSVRSRVTNIKNELPNKIDVLEFKEKILEYMLKNNPNMKEYKLTEDDLKEIDKIYKEKNTYEWVYGISPEYNIRRFKRFPSGKIEVFANIDNGKIKGIKLYGDFFGIGDITDIEEKLVGIKYTFDDIKENLKDIDIKYYFSGIELDDFITAIIE